MYIMVISILRTLLVVAFVVIPAWAYGNDSQSSVRAVLFYAPTCPHCKKVIREVIRPLLQQHGKRLKVVAIDTTLPDGQALYQAAVAFYQIATERRGVPTLIVGDRVMVGSDEIPTQFPEVVAQQLATKGVDWPNMPGLAEAIAKVETTPHAGESTAPGIHADAAMDSGPSRMLAKFQLDPIANSIAVAVLVFMIGSFIWGIRNFTRSSEEQDIWPVWTVPALSVLGIGVAAYLSSVEISGVEAVCGPIGDCNSVQLSPYATLFDVLPVGVLGVIGYTLIMAAWAVFTFGPPGARRASALMVWSMACLGLLFSIYLTFLEPFVIGATCLWCISSALFQTFLFFAASGPAKRAWSNA